MKKARNRRAFLLTPRVARVTTRCNAALEHAEQRQNDDQAERHAQQPQNQRHCRLHVDLFIAETTTAA
jgi:hypothetical protein